VTLLAGSAVASLLVISGSGSGVPVPVKWVVYLPFYGVIHLSSVVWQLTGIRVLSPLVFLVGVVLSAVYVVIIMEKMPARLVYAGMGVLFFIFLLIVGRAAFVQFIFVPLSTAKAAVYSVKVFFEFLVVLVLVYLVCGEAGYFSLEEDTAE
jgi:hypothetical protein